MTKNMLQRHGARNLISSAIAIVLGLLIGFIVMLISNPSQAFSAISTLMTGGIALNGFSKTMARLCYYSVPLIVCGLSVSFAYKTGTLNLGASGQYWVGGFCAIVVSLKLYAFLGSATWIVAILAGMVAGGAAALIPGVLKACRNVNIIVSCIMMNYIATYAVSLILNMSPSIVDPLNSWTNSIDANATIPTCGMDKLFSGGRTSANAGIVIAVLACVVAHFVIKRTTFGYELKMCGFNHHAAHYAGVSEKKSIILAMAISGMLAGLAGTLYFLTGTSNHISTTDAVTGMGFTGIAVALLGATHPLGVILSGLFIAYLQVGGINLQMYGFSNELIDIILAIVIYSCAFSQILGGKFFALLENKAKKNQTIIAGKEGTVQK